MGEDAVVISFLNFFDQVKELVGWVDDSNADFVILGGDFNTDPKDKETSYHNLKEAMISSMEEFFLDIKVTIHLSYPIYFLFLSYRSGSAPVELHTATLRTPTATCTPLCSTTTSGTGPTGGTWSGQTSSR